MFRRDFNPAYVLAGIVLAVLLVVVGITPVATPIHSLDETQALLARMGASWPGPGVPVIVFASAGCPASNALEAELQRRGLRYWRADVNQNRMAWQIHGELGRNYVGTVATRATPTTVVGTQVIRGNDVERIVQAITQQEK